MIPKIEAPSAAEPSPAATGKAEQESLDEARIGFSMMRAR
jgi:hypothetical protein